MWCGIAIAVSFAVGLLTVPVFVVTMIYRALSKDHAK